MYVICAIRPIQKIHIAHMTGGNHAFMAKIKFA